MLLMPSLASLRRRLTESSTRMPASGRLSASTDSRITLRLPKTSNDFCTSFPRTRSRPRHTRSWPIAMAHRGAQKTRDHYQRVEDCAVKQSQIDYAALQIGRIHEQLEQFKEMEEWFTRYLDKYGLKGDYTQAIYRKGFAQQAQGRSKEAIDTYWQAIEKMGQRSTRRWV